MRDLKELKEIATELKERIISIDDNIGENFDYISEYLYDEEYNGGIDRVIENAIDNIRGGTGGYLTETQVYNTVDVLNLLHTYNTNETKQKLYDIILDASDCIYINDMCTQWNEVTRINIGKQDICLISELENIDWLSDVEIKCIISILSDDRDVCINRNYAFVGSSDHEYFILKLDSEQFIKKMQQHFNK